MPLFETIPINTDQVRQLARDHCLEDQHLSNIWMIYHCLIEVSNVYYGKIQSIFMRSLRMRIFTAHQSRKLV